MKKRNFNEISKGTRIIVHGLFILTVICCLLPFVLVLSVSVSDPIELTRHGYKLIPAKASLEAYDYLFRDASQIGRSYFISVVVTSLGTFLSLVFIALYAYPLYRKDFPYRRFFAMFIFITMLFNGGLAPFYILYTRYLHLKDNIFALILPYLLNPFYVIIMRTFFTSSIPSSVVDSAKIDGAKEMYILLKIVFPLALPAFATIGLFSTLIYWNDWFMSLLFITKPENVTIQYYMYKTMRNLQFLFSAKGGTISQGEMARIPEDSIRMAMAIVGMGPIVIAYPFFQKYFVRGLTVGAVKG